MKRLALLLCLSNLAMAFAPRPGAAQHYAGELEGEVNAEAERCGMCHALHSGSSSPDASYVLRDDPAGRILGLTAAGGRRLGAVSRSCLRCHSTADIRADQPEFRNRGPATTRERGLLGADLSDDHPLAIDDRSSPMFSRRASGTSGASVIDGSLSMSGTDGAFECTRCHDPHKQLSVNISASEEVDLCLGCHDAAEHLSGSHATLACSSCHGLHGGFRNTPLLKDSDAESLCISCHEHGMVPETEAEFSAQFVPAPLGHVSRPRDSCRSCHPAH